jgi:hypothetical protein
MTLIRIALEQGAFAQFREQFVANYIKHEPKLSEDETPD